MDSVPSFFECAAEHFFVQSLHPAYSYLVNVISSRCSFAAFALKYDDELFFATLGAVNWHFLRFYNASFSENFYSLHRISTNDKNTEISAKQKILSLTFTVAVPFLRFLFLVFFIFLKKIFGFSLKIEVRFVV